MRDYFDTVHASKESQLYGKPEAVEDNEKVRALRQALKKEPDNAGLWVKLGDALSYQLRYLEAVSAYTDALRREPGNAAALRKRAGRYLTTLQLESAYADFTHCGALERNAEIELLSGLTAYMRRDYAGAGAHFQSWIAMAGEDTEELVAVIYWLSLCRVRERDEEGLREALALYSSDMDIGHHTAYQCGIRLFLGEVTPGEAMETAEAAGGEDRDLEYGMIVYAVAQYEFMRGNTDGYTRCLDAILSRDTFWPGFASLAALNDRHPEVAVNAELRGAARVSGTSSL